MHMCVVEYCIYRQIAHIAHYTHCKYRQIAHCRGRVSGSSAGRCLGSKAFTWKFLQRLVATDITLVARSALCIQHYQPKATRLSSKIRTSFFLQQPSLVLLPCVCVCGSVLWLIHCMASRRQASLKRGETCWKLLKMRHGNA